MIKVYGIPNCNTVKKAMDWLKENDLQYEFHDYKKKGITADKLNEWSDYFGWENIINKNGTTWKGLDDQEKESVKDQKSSVTFLAEKTSAIKRPIVESNGNYLIRFDEQEYSKKLL